MGSNLLDNIRVIGQRIHSVWSAFHMHQDDGGQHDCSHGEHFGIKVSGRHIVDPISAGLDGSLGHCGLARVNADSRIDACFSNACNHRHYSANLLLHGNFSRSRTRGLTTDVQDLCACGDHLCSSANCVCRIQMVSAITEGVGCDVQYSHDQCLLAAPPKLTHFLSVQATGTRQHLHRPSIEAGAIWGGSRSRLQALHQLRHTGLAR
mmetsp:Transcript_21650/g.50738  ORF Transcript_21650/g.50738 Transcript_21650/m.50738 type:complete len:207 (+) Transcript_21650:361-981(+)